jgi:surface protein
MVRKIATEAEIELQLNNTILPRELISIIFKYTKIIIKVKAEYTKVKFYTSDQFQTLDTKNIISLDIYGPLLIIVNPKRKFKESKIQNINGNIKLIGDASFMFQDARSFNPESTINDWDTSEVTYMECMLAGAWDFNQDLNLWDTSNVKDMNNMFCSATSFNSDISGWNTSKVRNMYYMFSNAINFDQNINDWDTSKVTNMCGMFNEASKFNQDISRWNVSNVVNMKNMFYGASKFNQDISGWNVSNVTDMTFMFKSIHRTYKFPVGNNNTFDKDLTAWKIKNPSSVFDSDYLERKKNTWHTFKEYKSLIKNKEPRCAFIQDNKICGSTQVVNKNISGFATPYDRCTKHMGNINKMHVLFLSEF